MKVPLLLHAFRGSLYHVALEAVSVGVSVRRIVLLLDFVFGSEWAADRQDHRFQKVLAGHEWSEFSASWQSNEGRWGHVPPFAGRRSFGASNAVFVQEGKVS